MLYCLLSIFTFVIGITHCVTPDNPCDPMQHNVTTVSIAKNPQTENMISYGMNPSWLVKPLRFIDCSRRGLTAIPKSLSTDVQILDFRSNAINEIKKDSFKLYVSLQVLILYSNCIGDSSHQHLYCYHDGVFEQAAFSSLINLKALDLGGNAFTSVPKNLPTSLEYLVLSRTGINQIVKDDFKSLQNLSVLIADNICFNRFCLTPFHIANDTFENLHIKFFVLQENSKVIDAVSRTNANVIYLSLSRNEIKNLQPRYFEKFSSLRRLELNFQFPNEKVHITVQNGAFDRLINLEYLDLSNNLTINLSKKVFQYNQNLKYLDLSENCLQASALNPTFVPTTNIQVLHLGFSWCKLPETKAVNHLYAPPILGSSFSKMKNLTLLSFGQPTQMEYAVHRVYPIRFYIINSSTVDALRDLKNLEKVIFDGNIVRSLDMVVLFLLKSLTRFDLQANVIANITFTESMRKVPSKLQWKSKYSLCSQHFVLLLSNNMIDNLQSKWLVNSKITYLGLEFNLLQSIIENVFENLPCLTDLNLQNNPLKFIHPNVFKNAFRLKNLYLSSTQIILAIRSLYFLNYIPTSINLRLTLAKHNLYDLMCNYAHKHISAPNVTQLDLSDNVIIQSKIFLQYVAQIFFNAKTLVLRNCAIKTILFTLSAPHITSLDLSHNQIDEITFEFLKGFPSLETLLFSNNKITYFSNGDFTKNPNLTHLDLSHNFIRIVSFDTNQRLLKDLKILVLSNNYIYNLSPKTFPLSFLSQLEVLDLRWNSIECTCNIHQNFGQWLSKHAYKIIERPGMLPRCSSSVNGFGGCVTCTHTSCNINHESLQQSLLQYSINITCFSFFSITLCLTFTAAVILFMIVGIMFTNSKCMLLLMKLATRNIRQSSGTGQKQNQISSFAYHGFVLFDKNDNNVGDWIDGCLLPNLTEKPPFLKIVVTGKDDQCGFSPVHQLVSKIEASRKVIVVLTRSFVESNEGQYTFSVLETLRYYSGIDRALIMTFENGPQVDDLLEKRRKINNWPVIKIPRSQNDWPIVWEMLKNKLK